MSHGQPAVVEPTLHEQLKSVGAYLRRALRFWHVPLFTLLLGLVAFVVYVKMVPGRFRSETVMLYAENSASGEAGEGSDTQRSVAVRLKELLYARPNLERVVRRFDLYPELRARYGMVDALEELKKHIEFRAPGGDTFSIAFEGSSAVQARDVTAELERLVIAGDADLRRQQAKLALDFLVGERQTRGDELRAAEEKLASFMAQHPRFALDATPLANGAAIRASLGGGPAPIGSPRFMALPRSGLTPAAAGAPGATSPPGATAPSPAASQPRAADAEEAKARAALAAARDALTEKLVHYTPAHPDVRAAQAEVQRATERLAAVSGAEQPAPANPAPQAEPASQAAPRSSSAPAAAAPTRAGTPVRVATAAPTAGQSLVELETEWLNLTRAVSEARQRQDQIEAQLFRADIELNSERGGHGVQVSVIDPAFLPDRPLPPGRLTLAAIFLTAGFALGVLGALALAIVDDRLFVARDFAGVADVLVEIPRRARRGYVAS
jgi:hypothetical protein